MDASEDYRLLVSEEHDIIPFKDTKKVLPGDKIGSAEIYGAGPGTYAAKGAIYAGIIGDVYEVKGTASKRSFLIVSSERQSRTAVPRTGSIVYAEVVKITTQRLECVIKVSDDTPIDNSFTGILRLQDVRQFETDKITLRDSFRPGDIIRALVLSMGDSKSFLLSTASNELGVVFGNSRQGGELTPLSWNTMVCSKTGQKEARKVAKPLPPAEQDQE